MEEEYADLETLSDDDSSSSSSSTSTSMNNDEPLAGFSPSLEPVNASWNSSINDSNSDEPTANVIQDDNHNTIWLQSHRNKLFVKNFDLFFKFFLSVY